VTILREGTHGTRWRAVGLGAFVLLGCAAEPLARHEGAIVGGTPATDEAVVAIRYVDGELRCSGTLVAPRVVLTAGHCGIHAGNYYGYEVFFGPDTKAAGRRLAVIDAVRHPAFDGPSFSNDLALLFLEAEAPATPKPLRTSALTPVDVASDVRIVGYGRTKADLDDAGLRRQGFARITDVTINELVLGGASQQCSYDSGGPTFTTEGGVEVLTGVTSRGDAACAAYARVVRVDAYRSFIDGYLADTGSPTRALGERCLWDGQCKTGLCLAAPDEPRLRYCSTACTDDTACGALRCLPTTTGATRCQYPTPTPRAPGAGCTTDADCFDTSCLAAPDGALRCAPACSPTKTACPTGFACTALSEIRYACFPAPAPEPTTGCAVHGATRDRSGGGGAAWALLTTTTAWARRRRRPGSRAVA